MPEIRFSVPKKLDEKVRETSNELGVDKSDYVKSLIVTDLRKKHSTK